MPSTTTLRHPRIHQFAIGEHPGSTDTLVGVLERLNAPLVDVIEGVVVNEGLTDFTLSLTTGQVSIGSLLLTGQPSDTNTIVIDDGPGAAITFEFDSNSSVVQSATLRQVVIGATLAETLANLRAAIIGSALNITPSIVALGPSGSTGSISLRNNLAGSAGNVTITETGTVVTPTGMAGGTGAAKNIRVNAASVASVLVKPHARVPFLIEIAEADVQDFYNFIATPATGTKAFGTLTLALVNGEFTHRNDYA